MFIPYHFYPELFVGPLVIHAWGLFVALGFLVGILLAAHRVQRSGNIDPSHIWNLGSGMFVSSMIGARIAYVVDHASDFQEWSEVLRLWDGGLGMMGGVFGAVVFFVWYVRWKKLDGWVMGDALAMGLPAAISVGRIGCHLIGDHPGIATNGNFGFVKSDLIAYHEPAIYESVVMLLVWGIFLLIDRYVKSIPRGFFVVAFGVAYASTRLLLDMVRAADPLYGGWTLTQLTSIVLLFLLIPLVWRLKKKQ